MGSVPPWSGVTASPRSWPRSRMGDGELRFSHWTTLPLTSTSRSGSRSL